MLEEGKVLCVLTPITILPEVSSRGRLPIFTFPDSAVVPRPTPTDPLLLSYKSRGYTACEIYAVFVIPVVLTLSFTVNVIVVLLVVGKLNGELLVTLPVLPVLVQVAVTELLGTEVYEFADGYE